MNEKIRSKSKILYIIAGSVIVLMGIIYLGVINSKITYSAEANCPNGYYDSKSECQKANNGYYCELNKSTGCYEKGSAICSAGKTFYANGVTQCQNETGYVCQCGYGNNGCCIVTDEKLGGGVDCTTGDTTGTCGDRTMEVCTLNTTYSCSISGKTYSYTCKHDSGSQTGISGSWSTCTIKQSSSSSSCTYASQAECQKANNGYYCELNKSTGCYEKGSAICSAGKTFYANGVTQCQKETGYVCQCGYGNNGCCIVTDEKLGGGVDCTTGNTTGSCGDSTMDVCTLNTTYSCTIGGKTYSYTCKHDSGSQTGISGSWSTCTLKQSSSSSSSSSSKPGPSSNPSNPNPSTPGSSTPGSSTPNPSNPSSSNVDKNPQTGSVAIFVVWVIALGMLVYSFIYFKQSKFE